MLSKFVRVLIVICWFASSALAQTGMPEASVPAALKEWRPWVLKGFEFRACPFIANEAPAGAEGYLCAWPGKLSLSADARGTSFAMHWRVEAPSWIALPGNEEYWPQDLTLNGQRSPVLSREEKPALWLEPGSYEIRGRIPWVERPQSLPIPEQIGLIELSVDGKPIAPLQREGETLTLGRVAGAAPEAESLTLRIFRRVDDGLPAILTTRIQMDIAGRGREQTFGPILPEGFAPMELSGGLPARLDPDGKLRVQVRPGSFTIEIIARALAPLTKITLKSAPAPWPEQEIWSYAAAPGLRATSASSAVMIDSAQAGVPGDWRAFPAFAMTDGSVLQVDERARGLATTDANRLQLHREAWMDFSGSGLFAKDRVFGRMVRDWRLEVAAPYVLQRAEADGEGLLVTKGAKPGESGVELRNPQVELSAGLRIANAGGALPINGWRQAFDSVYVTLHLPYGYRLLAAPGADSAAGSWISRWTLLDIFIVAVLALLALRLLGWVGGVAAALYLILGYQEGGAPLWTLAAVVALALILRALPEGKLSRFVGRVGTLAFALLVLISLPFVADQVRFALYPQLERSPSIYAQATGVAMDAFQANMPVLRSAQNAAPAPPPMPASAPQVMLNADAGGQGGGYNGAYRHRAVKADDERKVAAKAPQEVQSAEVVGSRNKRADVETNQPSFAYNKAPNMQRYAEKTVIQAGRGEPSWQYGSTYALSWNSPVLPVQSVHLLILPKWATRVLRLLIVALLALVVARLFGGRPSGPITTRTRTIATALVALGLIGSSAAHADTTPSENLLNELRTRLTEAPKCAPQCATVAQAQIRAQGDSVHVSLEAHAGERIAMPLPAEEKSLSLRSITLDGVALDAVLRREDGLWIAVPRGVHRIEMEFAATGADKIALPFPLKPAHVEFSGKGWEANGIDDNRLLTESLDLVRVRGAGEEAARGTTQQFPAFVRLTRHLQLNLEWQVENTVERLAPAEGGFSTELPLLKNEHVTTAQLKVREGKITVPMPDGEDTASWLSQLDRSDSLTLTAPAIADHAEVWMITLSPTWHAEFAGVPASQPAQAGNYWTHEFHPLPGESLTIKVNRPEAVEGSSLAIDSVSLSTTVGKRASEHTLALSLRSTQGGEQTISLPPTGEVLSVTKNNQPLNLRPRGGKLSLPVTPGAQSFAIRWRESREAGMTASTPQVSLGTDAANISLALVLPSDRWLLFVSGPAVGPAVLYWGEIIVMTLLAVALARTRRTPLKVWQWLLLGLGFSSFSWIALLVVVAWLLAIDLRERKPLTHDGVFNLSQIGLVLLTVAALLSLVSSIPFGLLGDPDMHLTGNGSYSGSLRWFADQSSDALPEAFAISLPIWVYRIAMLLWALWLASALIGWLRWAYASWAAGGYWRSKPKVSLPAATAPEVPPA